MKRAKKILLATLASLSVFLIGALSGCDCAGCKDCQGSSSQKPQHEHTWGEWAQTTAPTCMEAGEETRACSGCEETERRAVTGGHSATYHQAVEAGCDTFGNVEYWSCSTCLKNFSDEGCTTEIADVQTPVNGHTLVYHQAVEAGCDTFGNVEYWSCSTCLKNFSDEGCTTEITDVQTPATGHTWKGNVCGVCGDKKSSEGLAFVKIDGKDEYAVAGIGVCKDAALSIPSVYEGYPVTEIAEGAFTDNKGIVRVSIPFSVRSIGHLAFHGCVRLIEVYDETALSITAGSIENGWVGYYAKNVYTGDSGASKLTTDGDGFTVYTDGATRALVDYVGESANVTVPEGITEIGAYGLYAKEILSLRIPATVKNVGFYGVAGCSKLITVGFADGAELTELGRYAFYQCERLQEVSLPDSVKRIGDDAFYGCYRLTAVSLPQGLESIGGSAFYNCYHLTEIAVPSTVQTIDTYAFFNCYTLAEVRNDSEAIALTKGGTDNGYLAYYARNVYTGAEESKLQTEDGFVLYVDGSEKRLLGYVGEKTVLTVPNGVTAVNERAFYGLEEIREIILPTSVQTIGEAAFEACVGLEKLTLPFVGASSTETVNTHFGYVFGAYSGWYNQDKVPQSLKEVTVLGGEFIGESSFRNCKYLEKITLGASVKTIFNGAFYGCERLKECLFADGSVLETVEYDAFRNCTSLASIRIPASVKKLGDHAFHGCSKLQSVDFDADGILKEIGNNAFYQCVELRSIVIPDGVKEIENFTFYGCGKLASVELGSGVATIGDGAFGECSSLTSIVLPDTVTRIGHGAFSGCTVLSELHFSGTATEWGSVERVDGWKDGVPATQIVCKDDNVNI